MYWFNKVLIYFAPTCDYHSFLTYSMEQSSSWEANRFSASQEISSIYEIRSFITALTSARHLYLSWARSIQSMSFPHLPSWRSIWIWHSYLRQSLPSGIFPSSFPTPSLHHRFYMSCSSHSRFGHPNNIWWGLKIIKLLIVLFSPLPYYLVPLRPK